jgi:chorismate mutase/prephenate dehydratase
VLVRRVRVAKRVALWKQLNAQRRHDPRREAAVRASYADALQPSGWSPAAVDAWLMTLLQVSADVQSSLRVAFQGGIGSWSDESLSVHLPGVQRLACAGVDDAWAQVRRGDAVAAWLALRNSTIGEISDTRQVQEEGLVWLEVDHPIRHALVGRRLVDLSELRRIEGHPRALEQCRKTLDRLAPQAERASTIDGAHSARTSVAEPTTAFVGPARLADAIGGAVLAPDVCDQAENTTTFGLLVPKEVW